MSRFVAAFITDPAGSVLLVRHRERAWELPGGHVEPGERPIRAAIRECEEETGVSPLLDLHPRVVGDCAVYSGVPSADPVPLAASYSAAPSAPLSPRDPSGFIVEARWRAREEICNLRLSDLPSAAVLREWAGAGRTPVAPHLDAAAVRALREIAALAMRCDEGDCGDNLEDGEGKHRVATHVTSMWGAPVYLCAEHAPIRAENHRDAESKGSGKQPPVEPYEQPEAVRIALAALAALEGMPAPTATLSEDVRAAAESMVECAASWEPGARLLGNVTAAHVEAVARAVLGMGAATPSQPFDNFEELPGVPMIESRHRERLGREVRAEWVSWAREQPAPKPSWLVPWEGLSEPDKEVDRRIGERLYALGAQSARARPAPLTEEEARAWTRVVVERCDPRMPTVRDWSDAIKAASHGEVPPEVRAPQTPEVTPAKCEECDGTGSISCHAGRDGDCYWRRCPQERDNEPRKTGRSCPRWISNDEEGEAESPPCPACKGTGKKPLSAPQTGAVGSPGFVDPLPSEMAIDWRPTVGARVRTVGRLVASGRFKPVDGRRRNIEGRVLAVLKVDEETTAWVCHDDGTKAPYDGDELRPAPTLVQQADLPQVLTKGDIPESAK